MLRIGFNVAVSWVNSKLVVKWCKLNEHTTVSFAKDHNPSTDDLAAAELTSKEERGNTV